MQSKRVTDWINMILGIWLIISPWVLATMMGRAELIVLCLGIGILLVSIWALAQPGTNMPEWWNVVLGAILFFSPWLFGFYRVEQLAWNAWIVGVAVVILAFAGMPLGTHIRRPTPRT